MKAEIKETDKSLVTLEISVDKEKFEEAMEKSYKKNVKHIALHGFRKGKAPRKMIEKFYGESIFYEDAINFVFDYFNAKGKSHAFSLPKHGDLKML